MEKFTDEELIEIEKVCDMQASLIALQFGRVVSDLATFAHNAGTPNVTEFAKHLIHDYTDSYDTLRVISAKAAVMRKKVK